MGNYQVFFDGLALGFLLGFLAFYLFFRFKIMNKLKPRNEIDRLVDDIHHYYRHVSESDREETD